MSEDIYILGIESSCDETAAAVVKNGREVLSNIIASQVPIHRKYGGVVPEIASRNHIRNVLPVIDEALAKAQVPLEKINAVAVTYGPGLVGALLVGLSAGKALAWAADKPLIGVNHGRACFCQFFKRQRPQAAVSGTGCKRRAHGAAGCKGLQQF